VTGRRPSGDRGSALVEFTYLGVLLMVPLVYLLLAVFQVQSAAFAVTEASRQAGRAFVRADNAVDGSARAAQAVRLALADQGITVAVPATVSCDPEPCDLTAGQRVETAVAYTVQLPFVGGLFGPGRGGIAVSGRHVEVVDRFRRQPAGAAP
jgi:Flp pilus assembly protein TadG